VHSDDSMFLAANVPKIPHGGWFPLLVGIGLVVQMTTWRQGRKLVAKVPYELLQLLKSFVLRTFAV